MIATGVAIMHIDEGAGRGVAPILLRRPSANNAADALDEPVNFTPSV